MTVHQNVHPCVKNQVTKLKANEKLNRRIVE